MNRDRIAIVGGGIGGLSVAIALQRKGFGVTVYEGAATIQPLGAGLALAANAVKAFVDIGISDAVLQAGKVLKVLRIKDARGNILTETDSTRIAARFGVINNFTIHRADLHEVLINNLEPGSLRLGKRLVDWEPQGSSTLLRFSDGDYTLADYVIACDGIHSVVRRKLLPHVQPRYAGYTCWRGVLDNIPPGTAPMRRQKHGDRVAASASCRSARTASTGLHASMQTRTTRRCSRSKMRSSCGTSVISITLCERS